MHFINRSLTLFSLLVFSCNFLAAQSTWVQSQGFGGEPRSNAVSFTLNGKGYVGLGSNDNTLFSDFWQYDPATKKWSKVADFGGEARRNAVAFVLNGKAYVGLGQSGMYPDFTSHKDFWAYDPEADSWTETTAFGGSARYQSIAYTLAGKGFVMLGRDEAGYPTDVWAFDPANKTWTEKNEFTDEGRIGAFVFNLNDTIYVGHGVNYEGGSTNIQNNYLTYNAEGDTWTEVDIIPSNISIRNDIFYFSLNGKGYFGGGTGENKTWEYDPATNTWTAANNVGNSVYAISASTAFVIDTMAYLATGYSSTKYVNDFFKYNEGLIVPERPNDIKATIISTTAIEITWEDNSQDEAGFIVERSMLNPGNYKPIATVGSNITHYIDEDENLVEGVEYFYQIRAYNDGISLSPYYDRIRFGNFYTAPTGLAVNDNATTKVKLSWTDNANLEEGYIIERSVNDTLNWVVIDTVEADVTGYFDHTVTPQILAFYRVKGFYDTETTNPSKVEAAYLDEKGAWLKASEFPGMVRIDYFSFKIDDKFYLGAGKSLDYEYLKDFWAYDLDTDTWEQLADFGGGSRTLATAFSINGKGYAGMGSDQNGKYKDLWEYDPDTDVWTPKTEFSGVTNDGPISFVIDNKAYLLTGLDANQSPQKSFWEYDPAGDTWTPKNEFPGNGRSEGIGVSVNGLGYVGFGYNFFSSNKHQDIWEYNPNNDAWEEKAILPGDYDKWRGLFAVVQGDQIIIGTGQQVKSGSAPTTSKIWKYDISDDQWLPWGRFPFATDGHYGFQYNNNIYALGNSTDEKMEIYRYSAGLPSTPGNLTIETKVDTAFLHWYDLSAKETAYILERRNNTSGYLTIDTLDANTEQYMSVLPEDGKQYFFRLTALNGEGNSNAIEAESDWTPLKAPDSLNFYNVESRYLYLSWKNQSENAEKIEIYFSEDSLEFELDYDWNPDGTYYTRSLKENTTYYFKVRTRVEYSSPYKELFSEYVSVSQKTLLYEPEDFTAKVGGKGVQLSWKDSSQYETGYVIERSVGDEEAYMAIDTIEANITAYQDTTFEEGVSLYYRVKAISADNYSDYTEAAEIKAYLPPADFTPALISPDSIRFTWKNQSEVASSLVLRRGNAADSLNERPFNFTAYLHGNEETYLDEYVEENTVYRYYIQATDEMQTDFSPTSDIMLVHTPLKAPSFLVSEGVTDEKLQLLWQNNTEVEAYATLIEMAEAGGEFTELDILENPTNEYWVEDLVSGEDYQFRIKIFNDSVSSAYSNVLDVFGVPTGLDEELQENVNITLYPNPANDQLKILTEHDISEIKVIDLRGKIVATLVQSDQIYDISSLSQGIYMLSVTTNNQPILIRFIKQ